MQGSQDNPSQDGATQLPNDAFAVANGLYV